MQSVLEVMLEVIKMHGLISMMTTGNYFGHWNKRITRNQYLAWLTVRAYALVTPVTSYAVWSRVFLVGFSGSRPPAWSGVSWSSAGCWWLGVSVPVPSQLSLF